MPYKMVGKCVHKKNEDGTAGEIVKCHETKEQALKHMRALMMNVEDASQDKKRAEG